MRNTIAIKTGGACGLKEINRVGPISSSLATPAVVLNHRLSIC
jgi:hypothetical protein